MSTHTTQQTTTTTTTGGATVIRYNGAYIRTVPGTLKVVCLVGYILILNLYMNYKDNNCSL